MRVLAQAARVGFLAALACAGLRSQVAVSGRVLDVTGAAVPGARVELSRPGGPPAVTSSDPAGNFSLSLPAAGDYAIRAERQGFYLYQDRGQRFAEGESHLIVTLNRQQEFFETVEVAASEAIIDPQEISERKELDNAEALAIPLPASQDYRNTLTLLNGVVPDNAGRMHVAGAEVNQTAYSLDGFNISDPVSGRLEARVNLGSIQSMELQTGRFSAENGRGSAGVLNLQTKMGDDRWRFGGTNFIPGASTDTGLHINKWTPRLEFSGPIRKRRAWFHTGLELFYHQDVVHGLPPPNRTTGVTGSDLSRVQVNLTPTNILTAGLLVNLANEERYGLSILNPLETTTSRRQSLFVSSVRDQWYFGGALLQVGFADTRSHMRNDPQGSQIYQITPFGNRGNYFTSLDEHAWRQQAIADLFLPAFHLHGRHELKFGMDFEREAFHQEAARHGYEVLNADLSVARLVSFSGTPFEARKNFEGAAYLQDHWTPFESVALEAGLRTEWNEIARDLLLAPRFGAVWAPRALKDTKFSAGWGVYHDSINLSLVAAREDQASLSTFFLPGGAVQGPVASSFRVDDHSLVTPRYHTASLGFERKLPFAYYLKVEAVRRTGDRGLAFAPLGAAADSFSSMGAAPAGGFVYQLGNTRQDRYTALDVSARHTFAGRYEWFAGYTRSKSWTSAAVQYSLENPIFAPQMAGPLAWDAPHRFHTWGWLPLPNRALPRFLRILTRNTTAAYLLEYRTGFPFSVVDQQCVQVGPPGSMRFPYYFNMNLQLERQFRALRYLWAWRFGYENITANGNPNTVNNVMGTPAFLTYGRGQSRAFAVRLRLLGKS